MEKLEEKENCLKIIIDQVYNDSIKVFDAATLIEALFGVYSKKSSICAILNAVSSGSINKGIASQIIIDLMTPIIVEKEVYVDRHIITSPYTEPYPIKHPYDPMNPLGPVICYSSNNTAGTDILNENKK